MESILDLAKVIIPVAIFFVWVVRYENIVKEFKQYSLPDWLRDLVGITKLSCALLIATASGHMLQLGAGGLALLMVAALLMHLKVKNPPFKMLPAAILLIFSLLIIFNAN